MRANYGYADASGEYYIKIDTDKCDGCGDCVAACPNSILEVILDDYDEPMAAVKKEFSKDLGYVCPGFHAKCSKEASNCHSACKTEAIEHSW
jgi:ferredoxin